MLVLLALSWALAATPVLAQSGTPSPEAERLPSSIYIPPPDMVPLFEAVAAVSTVIDATEQAVGRMKDQDADLVRMRAHTEEVLAKASETAEALQPRLDAVRSQIAQLGVEPLEGAAPEAEQVTTERARLKVAETRINGALRTVELTRLRANQLLTRIHGLRRDIFANQLLGRTPHHPLAPETLSYLWNESPGALQQLGNIASVWGREAGERWPALLALGVLVMGLFLALREIVNGWGWEQKTIPGSGRLALFQRAALALATLLSRLTPPLAAVALLFAGLQGLGFLYLHLAPLGVAALMAVVVFLAGSTLARALLEPRRPDRRIAPLSDISAGRLAFLVRILALVAAFDILTAETARVLLLPVQLSVVQAFVASLLYAALFAAMAATPLAPPEATSGLPAAPWQPYGFKVPLALVATAITGLALAGYVALAHFLAGQTLFIGTGAALFVLLHLAGRAAAHRWTETLDLADPQSPVSTPASPPATPGLDRQRRWLLDTTTVLMDGALLLAVLPIVLLVWGFSTADIWGWFKSAVFGFDVGPFRVSLARIAVAGGIFAALLVITRMVQRWLSSSVLPSSQIDRGIAHSISMGIGYVGFGLALILALGFAGLDIGNLAIVAGALSVGIGFGLQSIVNNFVSGLILLAERPIKVGDWIVVKGLEGYVRRIGVRATEIETFDRASITLPNSELISGPVTNWTHRNALGRLVIRVTTHYQSDARAVRRALEEVAEKSFAILRHPAPIVSLDALGSQGPEFALRVHVADVNKGLEIETDLRMAILDIFRRDGLQIPYMPNEGRLALTSPMAETVVVRVSVDKTSDPEHVRLVLQGLADAYLAQAPGPEAVPGRASPSAAVTFDAIGDSGFDFSMRLFGVDKALASGLETMARLAVVKTLRQQGIALAEPRADIVLRDLAWVREGLARVLAERAASGGTPLKDKEKPRA